MNSAGDSPRAMKLTPGQVAAYLRDHPDFFERHADLLEELRVPHASGDGSVSLVERQLVLLRQQNAKLSRTLDEYAANARASDELARKLNRLVTRLLDYSSRGRRLRSLPAQLQTIFSLDFVRLLLFDAAPADCAGAAGLKSTPREELMAAGLRAILKANAPRCGRYSSEQRAFLFGKQAEDVASVALAPLGHHGKLGVLALGSREADHYHRGKSTEFLGRVSAIVAVVVSPETS